MTGVIMTANTALRVGPREAVRRAALKVSDRLRDDVSDYPVMVGDLAESTNLSWRDLPEPPAPFHEQRPVIGWVCTPPSPGSGGHTTLFRMIAGLEERGYKNVLFLYDRHDGDPAARADVVRRHWPWITADIRDAREGVKGVDAAIASSWETAHALVSRLEHRLPLLYFIQDYEPYFYPRGARYSLAEDTYRFGMVNVALGNMVSGELARRGIHSLMAPFGCDTAVYRRDNDGARRGVVAYVRPGTDRRGYLLAKLALEQFHRRRPEHPIHVYGDARLRWTIPVVNHGRLTPAELNDLYNGAVAGLALSFTNISLVAEELLAAGTIPIINDSSLARADLAHPEAEWAVPTPGGIAAALCRAVDDPAWLERSRRASTGVRDGWDGAKDVVASAVASALAGGV